VYDRIEEFMKRKNDRGKERQLQQRDVAVISPSGSILWFQEN